MSTPVPGLTPVSWTRMIRAVEKVRERLLRAARALDAARIPYAVVGGNAVAAHVSKVDETAVRTPRDVDVLLRRSDLEAAGVALATVGFIHRRVSELGMPEALEVFLDGPEAGVRDALHVRLGSRESLTRQSSGVPRRDRIRSRGRVSTRDTTRAGGHGAGEVSGQGPDASS